MTESSSPAQYYELVVPQQFAAMIAGASDDVLSQAELTATYVITGEGGGTYGLRAHGKEIEFVPGGIEGSDMLTTMTIENWRTGTENDGSDPFVGYVRRGKVEVVKSLKGTVRLELARDDGSVYESATIFGGEEEPAVTLRMNTDDYAAMMRGELNGQMAFMTGKLKFEGSLPLLMQIGSLSG